MFFSQGSYYSPDKTNPDGESIYGSMRDFYSLMSNGAFDISGYLLNIDENADGKSDWITLPNSKGYYDSHSNYSFRNTAKNAATSMGYNVSTISTTKLVIIYAGHMYRTGGGLHPRATGNEYVMSEKFAFGAPYNSEHPNATFFGIGVHCHEFGHLLGWPDTYGGTTSNTYWSLMASGKAQKANAPAPICPEFRIGKGWVAPIVVTNDTTVNLTYGLKTPNIYKISDNTDPNRYFLIENRSFVSKEF